MKYCFIKDINGNFMTVNENFVSNKKYALLFTTKAADKIVDKHSELKIVKDDSIKSLSEYKIYRLKEIPPEFLIKKQRKSRNTNKTKDIYNDEYLFKNINKKCLSCKKYCKQPSVVTIIHCPDFINK